MGNAATILALKGTQVFTIEAHRTALSAVREMNRRHIGALLVVNEEGSLKGILTERDILRAIASRPDCLEDMLVHDQMTRDLVVCAPQTPINEMRMLMKTRRVRHLPVVDDGQLVGLISIGDVNAYLIAEEEVEIHWLHRYILGEPAAAPPPAGIANG